VVTSIERAQPLGDPRPQPRPPLRRRWWLAGTTTILLALGWMWAFSAWH
jgi:hypothetical protein